MNRFRIATFSLVISGFLFAPIALAERAAISVSPMLRLADGSDIPGTRSRLVRNDTGIAATINTKELAAGAYTIWWVIYNNPELCTSPCDLDDEAEDSPVQASVLYATGHVVGSSGIGNFGAYLRVGDTSGREVLLGPGLLNPRGAEILLVVRYHGPVVPNLLPEQISTFDGACMVNNCESQQFTFHNP